MGMCPVVWVVVVVPEGAICADLSSLRLRGNSGSALYTGGHDIPIRAAIWDGAMPSPISTAGRGLAEEGGGWEPATGGRASGPVVEAGGAGRATPYMDHGRQTKLLSVQRRPTLYQ